MAGEEEGSCRQESWVKGLLVTQERRAGTSQGRNSGWREGDRLEGRGGVRGGPPLGSGWGQAAPNVVRWPAGVRSLPSSAGKERQRGLQV